MNVTTVSKRSDTCWWRWARILAKVQTMTAGLPENDPKRGDTVRILKWKILAAINSGWVVPTTVTVIGGEGGDIIGGEGGDIIGAE